MARFLIPLGFLVALVVVLGVGLGLNPREVPSPLIGKPLPDFALPRVKAPEQRLTRAEFQGRPTLLNVWATWCVGCRQEHGLLVDIARDPRYPIFGLNYKDQIRAAVDWLHRFGDPYQASGYDAEGEVGLDLGVYGLPETFVVDADGTIAYKHVGPLTVEIWEEEIRPLMDRLNQASKIQ